MFYKLQNNIKNPGSYTQKNMLSDLKLFSKDLTLWGSKKVVDKWVQFRTNSIYTPDSKDTLYILEDIMNEMRKDLGVKKVKEGKLDDIRPCLACHNACFANAQKQDGGANSGNTITIKDMADVMKSTGRHFDFLLFDACNMATIEVYYDFKDLVDYMIGSVLEVPAVGFPYESSLPYLFDNSIESYKKVCDEFVEFYDSDTSDGGSFQWGTVSLVDNKQLDNLVSLVKL